MTGKTISFSPDSVVLFHLETRQILWRKHTCRALKRVKPFQFCYQWSFGRRSFAHCLELLIWYQRPQGFLWDIFGYTHGDTLDLTWQSLGSVDGDKASGSLVANKLLYIVLWSDPSGCLSSFRGIIANKGTERPL